MAFEAMSDGMTGGGNWQKLLEEQLKKQFGEGASQKSAQVSAQSAQGDSNQVAMMKAVASQQLKKQQQSSQNNMPANQGGGGNVNAMTAGGGGGGKNQLGTDIEKREKTDVMGAGMDAYQNSFGNPYAAAAAVVMAGLEETEAIRQERKEIEKKAKEEEAKGVQNVGDIWTALAGQMKGLLR